MLHLTTFEPTLSNFNVSVCTVNFPYCFDSSISKTVSYTDNHQQETEKTTQVTFGFQRHFKHNENIHGDRKNLIISFGTKNYCLKNFV